MLAVYCPYVSSLDYHEASYESFLKELAVKRFGDMVMAIGAQMHADEEQMLLEDGSAQEDLWGINLYPEKFDENFIEFDSMINLRPRQNNRTRSIDDPALRERIRSIVSVLVPQ